MSDQRVIVGITGATGAIYGVRALETLAAQGVQTHLILSPWGKRTIEHETGRSVADVQALATTVEGFGDLASRVSSGSFETAGMLIAPCSVKTLAAIAVGLADNLISRAADVVLKESRRLVMLVRETPLHEIHLDNMLRLARMGATVMPPVPAFYNNPTTIDDLVDYTVMRALDQLGLSDPDDARRWDGQLQRTTPGNVQELR